MTIERLRVPVRGEETSVTDVVIDLIVKVNELIDRENDRIDPFAEKKATQEPE